MLTALTLGGPSCTSLPSPLSPLLADVWRGDHVQLRRLGGQLAGALCGTPICACPPRLQLAGSHLAILQPACSSPSTSYLRTPLQYLLQDLLYTTVLASVMGFTHPAKRLSKTRPPARLMSLGIWLPVMLQFTTCALFQVGRAGAQLREGCWCGLSACGTPGELPARPVTPSSRLILIPGSGLQSDASGR